MTVTLDLPPRLAGAVEADAQAHGQAVADYLLEAVAGWYEDVINPPTLPQENGIIPAKDIAPLRRSLEEAERGEHIDGETVMQELFRMAGTRR